MRLPLVVLTGLLAAALGAPAAASAACAPTPLGALTQQTPVIVTAQAQDGPTSVAFGGPLLNPAAFRVKFYDKGSGPKDLKVTTGAIAKDVNQPEGIFPLRGQTWRLYGALDGAGLLTTGLCQGSLATSTQASPVLQSGARRQALTASNVAGVPHRGKLPVVTAGRAPLKLSVAVTREVPISHDVAVLLVRGGKTSSLKVAFAPVFGEKLLTGRLPSAAARGGTLIVLTRRASYALTLRAA